MPTGYSRGGVNKGEESTKIQSSRAKDALIVGAIYVGLGITLGLSKEFIYTIPVFAVALWNFFKVYDIRQAFSGK